MADREDDERLEAPRQEHPSLRPPAETFMGRYQPWLILLILGAPSVFSMIALSDARDYGESAIITLMVASPLAGIVAACIFGTRFKRPLSGTHIAATLGMIIVFTIASVALSFAGCLALFKVFGG